MLRADRDLVFLDQRGTGYSGLLACGPVQAALGVLEVRRPDLAPEIEQLYGGIVQQALLYGACARAYVEQGVDLAQYTSAASARDVAALAGALGYTAPYNLYGTSYGTELALNALRTTPDRVRSVVLDGVVPPQVDGIADNPAGRVEHFRSIFDLCAADAACASGYPDLERRFAALLAGLRAAPLAFDPPLPVQAQFRSIFGERLDAVTPAFFVQLAKLNNGTSRGGLAPLVPRLIHDLERRDASTLALVLGEAGAGAAARPARPRPRRPRRCPPPTT